MAKKEYSFTRLETFDNCPRMFKFKYLDEIPESFEIIEAYFGTVIHKVLEYAYSESHKKDIHDLIDYFEEAWEDEKTIPIKIVRSYEDEDQYLRRGKKILRDFYFTEYNDDITETIELEHIFKFSLLNKYLFTGKVDRVARDEDGIYHVIDYKTSKKTFGFENSLKSLQIRSYGSLVIRSYDLDEVYLHYKFLRHKRDISEFFKSKDVKEITTRLKEKINYIESQDSFPAFRTGLCGWCRYIDECEYSANINDFSYIESKVTDEIEEEDEDFVEKEVKKEKDFKESVSLSCINVIERYIEFSKERGKAKKLYPVSNGKGFELKGRQYGEYLTHQDSYIPEESIGQFHYESRSIEVSVSSYNPKTGKIVFYNESQKLPDIPQGDEGRFEVDLLWLYQQLRDFIETSASQIDLKFIDNFRLKPKQKRGKQLKPSLEEILDDHQKNAIIDSSSTSLAYIWGPPGTGKTTACLSGLVDTLLNNKKKVVILAITNAAVNVIYQSLLRLLNKEEKKYFSKERMLLWPHVEKVVLDKELIVTSYLNEKSRELNIKIHEQLLNEKEQEIEQEMKKIERKIHLIQLRLNEEIDFGKAEFEKRRFKTLLSNLFDKRSKLESIELEISKISQTIRWFDIKITEYQNREPTLSERIFGGHGRKPEKIKFEKSKASNHLKALKNQLEEYGESTAEITEKITIVEQLLELINRYKTLKKELHEILKQDTAQKDPQVFLGTFASMLSRLSLLPAKYHLIVDEASSAPSAWVLPFLIGAQNITFLGDHKQLPCVYEGDENDLEMKSWLKSSVIELIIGLRKDNLGLRASGDLSLEELGCYSEVSTLKKSYRLQEPIAKIADELWYKTNLKGVDKYVLFPIILVDTSNLGARIEKEGTSRMNRISAEYVIDLIKQNLISSLDLMIISPYRAQVNLYQKLLKENNISLPALTVHRAQGSEAETVVFDVTDGKGIRPYFTLEKEFDGADQSPNLLCVALTRSKELTVIVADKLFWLNRYPKSAISAWITKAKKIEDTLDFNYDGGAHKSAEENNIIASVSSQEITNALEKEKIKDTKDFFNKCGLCSWFEVKFESAGQCKNSAVRHHLVYQGDEACLAFKK